MNDSCNRCGREKVWGDIETGSLYFLALSGTNSTEIDITLCLKCTKTLLSILTRYNFK